MQKSRVPLIALILLLGCVLCLCAAVTGFAVLQVIRTVTDVDLPQMRALLPPAETVAPPAVVEPAVTSLPPRSRAVMSVNRIVAQGVDGNVYTIDPAGGEAKRLTESETDLRVHRQPTWSPDANRIAWVEIEGSDTGLSSALVTARADGSGVTRADTGDRPPFYLAWSPDGARVAALSSWDEQLALRLVDIAAGGADAAMVSQARPFYFAWSPDSRRFLAHLSFERVSLLSGEGEETQIAAPSAFFGAPDWMPDGAAFVYGKRNGGAQELALADPSGADLASLASFAGSATFSISPDNARIAFIDSPPDAPTAAFGKLFVTSLVGGEPARLIDDGPALAFFWSPQGDKIAYLTPGDRPAEGPRASLEPTLESEHLNLWLQWHVWDGERTYTLSQFRPSDTFLVDYLRFFDQYSRSMTPWAPDGSAFVYAGDSQDENRGVWVQPAAEGSSPVRIMDGVYAAWSPR